MSDRPRIHITWQISNDGLRPTECPWGYVLRNPLARVIQPGQKVEIDLQIAANFPMLAFPVRSHQDDVTVPLIIQAGQDVVCVVENRSQYSPLIIEDKEALVNLFPLAATPSTSEVG